MVKAGDKILLVEAMKTFNEIVAPKAGKVVEVKVAAGQAVEFETVISPAGLLAVLPGGPADQDGQRPGRAGIRTRRSSG